MGLLGDLALGLAGMALEALTSDDENNSSSKSSSARPYAVLFETNWPFSMVDMRNEFLQNLIFKIGNTLGIEISENRGMYWDCNIDEASDGQFISDFVITNGNTTVCYGMFGMAQCALSINGENAGKIAEQLQSTLKEMDCWQAEITHEEVPFHNKNWMKSTIESLCHGDSDSEEDENEEEDDHATETLMLISVFLGGDGSKITDNVVELVAVSLQGLFKREFSVKQIKSEMAGYIEEFKKSSYKMLKENLVNKYDDDDVFQKLYYYIFVFAYLMITNAGRFSKFSAEFIIKTKRILKINEDIMEEIIAEISQNEKISEHDLKQFYERMKFCANDSTSIVEAASSYLDILKNEQSKEQEKTEKEQIATKLKKTPTSDTQKSATDCHDEQKKPVQMLIKVDSEKATEVFASKESTSAESSGVKKDEPALQEATKQKMEKQTVVTEQVSATESWLLKIPLDEIETKYKAEKQAGEARISPFTDNLHFAKLSPKKVNGTRSYAQLSANETPVLVYDDTVFGSAKDGFLITDKAIYIHKAFEANHTTIPLEKVYSLELKTGLLGGAGEIMLNGTSMAVTVVTGGERKKLFAFLQEVIKV